MQTEIYTLFLLIFAIFAISEKSWNLILAKNRMRENYNREI